MLPISGGKSNLQMLNMVKLIFFRRPVGFFLKKEKMFFVLHLQGLKGFCAGIFNASMLPLSSLES